MCIGLQSTARWSDSIVSCSKLSEARARGGREERASGDSSSHCSRSSLSSSSGHSSHSGSSSSRLLSQAGRQPCQHRRGREPLQASLGPAGGSRSPAGAAVDHIWSATALTRVQLTLPERILGTARTSAVFASRETTVEKRRWKKSRRSSAGLKKCEAS